MARFQETPEVFEYIRSKAQANAMKNGSYGTKAEFEPGRVIVTLESVLSRDQGVMAGFASH